MVTCISLGCVDVFPLYPIGGENQLFFECELTVGNKIVANIYHLGESGLLQPRKLDASDADTLKFSISESDKDASYLFNFNPIDSSFYIEENSLTPKANVSYKIKGIGLDHVTQSLPTIVMPSFNPIDTFLFENIVSTQIGDSIITTLTCHIRMENPIKNDEHYYVVLTDDKGNEWIYEDFYPSKRGFELLCHQSGFVFEGKESFNREFAMKLKLASTTKPKSIKGTVYFISEQYYRYNLYKSRVTEETSNNSLNPPIAGFNIQTSTAQGSFSGKTVSQHEQYIP